MDHYWLCAETYTTISDAIKTTELYSKLPWELRLQLNHIPNDAALTTLCDAIRKVWY